MKSGIAAWRRLLLEEKVPSAARRMRCFLTSRTQASPFLPMLDHRHGRRRTFLPALPVVYRSSDADTSSVTAWPPCHLPLKGKAFPSSCAQRFRSRPCATGGASHIHLHRIRRSSRQHLRAQARGQLPPRQTGHERVKAIGAHRQPAARTRPQVCLLPRRQRRKAHLTSPHPHPSFCSQKYYAFG